MQAYYASAISVDLLKREQDRIDNEITIIQLVIGVDTEKLEQARDLAEMAMKVLGSAREVYVGASPTARQRLNKVIFKRVLIERGKVLEF